MVQVNRQNPDDNLYYLSNQNSQVNGNCCNEEDVDNIFAEKETEKEGGLDTIFDYGGKFKDITVKTFSDNENFGDFLNKQNYIASTVISQGFDVDNIYDILDNYEEIRDSKKQPYQLIESSLSECEQREARQYAVELLANQLQENIENVPDYGDVRSYYNEGSLMDWIVSHPVSFGADALAEKTGAEWYTKFSQEWLGKDGVFTPLNIGTYIADACNGDSEIRQDHWSDMFGNIQTTEDIDAVISNKLQIITELQNNVDNPEKFAELYYLATEGINFSADNVMEYKNTVEEEAKNGVPPEEQTKPSDSLIGRNYIAEDIAKNEMMTNIAYEVNKTVGTKLCSMIPFVGPLVAGVVNVGVTVLEEKTQEDSEITKGEWTKIILTEGFGRYFAVNKIGEISSKFPKGKGIGKIQGNAIASSMKEGVDITNDAVGNIVDGDGKALIGNGIEAGTGYKSIIKTAFKSLFSIFKK